MNKKTLILLLLLMALPLFSLVTSGLPVTHDGQDHVARIANFYANLSEGIFFPRWGGNLNWGFGHPVMQFLYPFPSYFASLFHFIGFSLVDSVKIVFAMGILLSGVFMFLWLSAYLSSSAALIGSLLYTFAPYRFVDLYVRGAIGENTAFIWMPLILYCLLRLSRRTSVLNVSLMSFSTALLILSHNAISLVFLPFILFYACYLFYLSKKRNFMIAFVLSMFLGLGISAFFWIPAILESKYTLREIVRTKDFSERFVSLPNLIYGPWSYGINGQFTVQLGLVQIFAIIFTPYLLFKKVKRKGLIAAAFILTISAILLMLPFSNWFWLNIPFLKDFQFPWRLLTLTTFTTALLGALIVDSFTIKIKKIIVFTFIVVIVVSTFSYWHPRDYQQKPENFYSGIYNSTTDTGESSPIWSTRFMEKRSQKPIEVIGGSADVKNLERLQSSHSYKINVSRSAQFLENTVYFPGWEITANGQSIPIEFQDLNHRGLITFRLDKGDYLVKAVYNDTRIRQYSNLITIVSLIGLVGLFTIAFIKR